MALSAAVKMFVDLGVNFSYFLAVVKSTKTSVFSEPVARPASIEIVRQYLGVCSVPIRHTSGASVGRIEDPVQDAVLERDLAHLGKNRLRISRGVAQSRFGTRAKRV